MALQKWQLLSSEDVSPSKWFPLFKHTVKLPNGRVVDDFYVSHLGDVGTTVAITAEKKILFVRQYKHGLGEITIELPAGRVQPGKSALESAQAELLEETGYRATNWQELGGVCPIPTKDGSIMHGFLATGLENTGATHFDDNEEIELLQLSYDEAMEKIKNNEIIGSDCITILTLAKLKFPDFL